MDDEDFIKQTMKESLNVEAETVSLNEMINVGCNYCGECCFNQANTVITPYDIYRMCKVVDRQEIVDAISIWFGEHSKALLVALKNGYCNFLRLHEGKFLCKLQECKPSVCDYPELAFGFKYDIIKNPDFKPGEMYPRTENFIPISGQQLVQECRDFVENTPLKDRMFIFHKEDHEILCKNHNKHKVSVKDYIKNRIDNALEESVSRMISLIACRVVDFSSLITMVNVINKLSTDIYSEEEMFSRETQTNIFFDSLHSNYLVENYEDDFIKDVCTHVDNFQKKDSKLMHLRALYFVLEDIFTTNTDINLSEIFKLGISRTDSYTMLLEQALKNSDQIAQNMRSCDEVTLDSSIENLLD